jgi:hypothetical protein
MPDNKELEIDQPDIPEIEQQDLPELEVSTDQTQEKTRVPSEELRYENADSIYRS